MSKAVTRIRKRRTFSEDFKKILVREYESGAYSICELSRLHNIAFQSLYTWVYKYSTVNKYGYRVIEMEKSSTKKIKDLESKIKELEQSVGQKQIKIEFLEKVIEIADKKFDIEIKKK